MHSTSLRNLLIVVLQLYFAAGAREETHFASDSAQASIGVSEVKEAHARQTRHRVSASAALHATPFQGAFARQERHRPGASPAVNATPLTVAEDPWSLGLVADSVHARRRFTQDHLSQILLKDVSAKDILFAVGGGTGAGPTANGDPDLDQDMLQRMRYQDKVVLGLLLISYFTSLLFSASMAYRQACNASPVKYYGDPRIDDIVVDSNNPHEFLEAFNQPPKLVRLQVQGLTPIHRMLPHMIDSVVEWKDGYYQYDFSFSLDLSTWVVPVTDRAEANLAGESNDGGHISARSESVGDGLSEADVSSLGEFLRTNSNDLATVSLTKNVEWPGWEELATNIKQKIRQAGFTGVVLVTWNNTQTITIYKNKPWANFLHLGVTRMILGLSAIGYLWYLPYMWLRQRGPDVSSNFRVDITISDYWQLVGDKIGERGFED
eukprot:TRINITY_DN30620_c0_g1_i1.p1 TRINITY_DN30620_c0_g1~~TRINITY_DN30620_c0_g1_i1.p1  ORF type:complete len:435 (+),score=67.35 TRINITY_DN30620_c0_g1_i1:116-1420(+)